MHSQRALADLAAWLNGWAKAGVFADAAAFPDSEPVGSRPMSPRRSAFIDVGTNTILCLIADIRETGRFRVLDDLGRNRRLGSGRRSKPA